MTNESGRLYEQSSKLRAIARMLGADGYTERPGITFTACELDGFSSMLIATADNIDGVRDRLPSIRLLTESQDL